jgi:hypothetical protein
MGLSQFLLALASAVILRSHSCETHDHILISHIQDSPNLEGQVPVFISHKNRVAQLYFQALGSLFITSYNLQYASLGSLLYSLRGDSTENITSNSSSIVVMGGYLAIAWILLTCLPAVTKQCMFLLMIIV